MSKPSTPAPNSALSRRTVFAGAAGAGALATAAVLLPTAEKAALQTAGAGGPAKPDASSKGGYQLTDHVKQYYATARV